jgi:uncharacterized protein (DUF433 family)
MTDESIIHDRGRGPEIRGTRITVYDVLDYYPQGWSVSMIAELFHVKEEQVRAAIEYVEAHREEVMAEYEKILERDRQGNPPEIRERFAQSHQKLMKLKDELRRKELGEANDARAAG